MILDNIESMAYDYICRKANELYEKASVMTAPQLIKGLEKQGIHTIGNSERKARSMIRASLDAAMEQEEFDLVEKIASSFTSENGWPILTYAEGGRA